MTRHTGLMIACVVAALMPLRSQTAPAPTPWDPTIRPVWRLPGPTLGVPSVDGDDVFVLTPGHWLLKVSATDGSERWRVSTGETGATPGWVTAVTPSLVLVGEYDLAAFDRVTGRRRWVFVPEVGHAPGPFMGEVHGSIVLTGSGSGHLFAIDVDAGTARWQVAIDTGGLTSVYRPRVMDDLVVAGFTRHHGGPANGPTSGGVVAVRLADGQERWRFEFPLSGRVAMNMAGGPLVAGDLVLAASGDGRVWALDRRSGSVQWTISPLEGPLDAIIQPGVEDYRSLGLWGRTLLIGSTTGYVVGYDLDERRERWRYAGGRLGSTWMTMAATSELAFVPYAAGYLTAIDMATGELRWRTDDWQQGFIWAPALSGRLAIAASKRGLWALSFDREDQR